MKYKAGAATLLFLFFSAPILASENIISGKALFDAGATSMSELELKSFLKLGSNIETFAPVSGAIRFWTHDESGKFIASRQGGAGNARSQGTGEWKITDSGQYCVVIDWRTARGLQDNTESWCRVAYRQGDAVYLAPKELAGNVDNKYSVLRVR